jgi:hypothetical protein
MAEGSYELGARVGLGIKMAHEAALKLSTTYAEYVENLGHLTAPVVEHVIDTPDKFLVTDAFPGSTVISPAVAPAVQQGVAVQHAPQQQSGPTFKAPPPQQSPQAVDFSKLQPAAPLPMAQVNQSGPPPVPNRSTGGDWKAQKAEEAFQLFMQDTTAWDDVRDKKTSDNSPDFRHKFAKDPPNKDGKEYKKSLWLRDAPEWARPQLQQWGLL